ncbi:helix-turn-helix transcriptional regulator [Kitasatospora phosalacinea]|uniref:PhpR n=1 Tax=Kitasatospora phosalacinea TaxID=2065 RepID=A0A0M3WNF8_9ACTN|nr:LuxR C-terminal-related transcriptional regulator [Kitasatospora phosalacinea]AKO69621.1 PhpR [Kitasatospora phosalacinea]
MKTEEGTAYALFRAIASGDVRSRPSALSRLKLTDGEFDRAVDWLVDAGLLVPPREPGRFPAAVSADVAAARLAAVQLDGVLERVDQLRELHLTLESLVSAPRRCDGDARVRTLVGESTIAEALDRVSLTAHQEILSMHPGVPLRPQQLEDSMERNRRAIARGVQMRAIHIEAMERVAHGVIHLRSLQDAGLEVRLAAILPFRMILVDRFVAFLSTTSRDNEIAALEITDRDLCASLHALFDYCWITAVSPTSTVAAPDEVTLSKRELVILRMYASGLKDAAVARSLGVSARTLRRVTSEMMEKLGAESRFQAGVKAIELGLLGDSVEALESHHD